VSDWFERFGFAAVHEGLLVGAYPSDSDDVERLRAEGVDRVFNLCEDGEYATGDRDAVSGALAGSGIEEDRLPLVDYGGLEPEALERSVTAVDAALERGETVYLHCRAGWQRSAAVAAGIVALREATPIEEALVRVRARKPTAEPLAHQRDDLLAWWQARGRLPGPARG